MSKIAIYTKTYHIDFPRVKILKESIDKHNVDNIPYYISCPSAEKQLLVDTIGVEGYTFISDEDINPPNPRLTGWMQQTPIKLRAYEQIKYPNLLLVDSDAFFIRDFYESDFIAYDDIPYSIIHENKHHWEYDKMLEGREFLNPDREYVKSQLAHRKIFGGKHKRIYDYGPNPHLFSSKVLDHFKMNVLEPNGLNFETFYFYMKQLYPNLHPRESFIYSEYLHTHKPIDIIPIGPLFKVYHGLKALDFDKKIGVFNIENLKSNYLGILTQSKIDPTHPEAFK